MAGVTQMSFDTSPTPSVRPSSGVAAPCSRTCEQLCHSLCLRLFLGRVMLKSYRLGGARDQVEASRGSAMLHCERMKAPLDNINEKASAPTHSGSAWIASNGCAIGTSSISALHKERRGRRNIKREQAGSSGPTNRSAAARRYPAPRVGRASLITVGL
jgi:hypothetical protein